MAAGFQTFYFVPVADGDPIVQLHPTWGFSERVEQIRKDLRTLGGQLNTYKLVGENYSYTIPIDFVSSSDAYYINKWWRDQSEFYFSINIEDAPLSLYCRITNSDIPLSTFSEIQNDLYSGLVSLRSVRSQIVNTSPFYQFTLDDPFLGKLDQTYNLLSPNPIVTRSTVTGKLSGLPFRLDDPILSKLDQTYNFLA